MVKNINELSWVESNQPTTKTKVIVGKDFNVYNYRVSKYSMKIANVLAVGGTVVLTDNKSTVTVRLEDEEQVLNYQLQQLEYLLSRYNKITGYYAKLAWQQFSSRDEAIKYFQSEDWKSRKLFKLNALDVLLEALTGFEADRRQNIHSWAESKRRARLWNEAAKMGIFKRDWEQDLPNQDVTTPIQPGVEGQVRIGEFGPYPTFTGPYAPTPTDQLEAAIVNAWYYNQPEFRVPSLDEQIAELEELRAWFEQYKYHARRNNVRKPQARTIEKFERLEFLEIEVGTYLEELTI